MTLKKSTVVWTFLWCLFMGVTAISIGLGALFPPLNDIAGPFVCPGGALSVEQQEYDVSPAETVTTITWYCTDGRTGAKNEVSMWPMSLASGLIYGLLLFLVVFVVMLIRARRSGPVRPRGEEYGARFSDDLTPSAQAESLRNEYQESTDSALEEMEELTKLRDSHQIGEAEFLRKKQELMSKMRR